ncbi:uncharacterized protein FOMMEDRAFT_148820 [Fomitiporia mediterranea MF3/22]|uniref:uncharacterized protein n=1 Tax=Fomitiporia mediterranea (strain MF3/22) TaxID=694068 RepID=UPI0004409187|nr:uncharacterized protein FOMMEDRAFT_148820 [Fomitiporia mediterranea MF3/22]EJC99325.1 hypothetical protein FOMMEDRAFT_148820 [Fomitiporia mediterranea MF3/22]
MRTRPIYSPERRTMSSGASPGLVIATKYLTLSSIAIIAYDAILSFEIERITLWRSRTSALKVAYVLYRYLVMAVSLLSFISITAGIFNEARCQRIVKIISIVMFSADAIGHALVIFRTFMLWGRRTTVLRLMFIGSFIANSIALSFLVLTVRDFSKNQVLAPAPTMHTCAAIVNPRFLLGIWLPQVVFDIYVTILVLLNAMDQPRLSNKELMEIAIKDGLFLILVTWVLRMVNAMLCTTDNELLPFISISFVEALITVINLRLLLHIFQSEDMNRIGQRDSSMELALLLKRGSCRKEGMGHA